MPEREKTDYLVMKLRPVFLYTSGQLLHDLLKTNIKNKQYEHKDMLSLSDKRLMSKTKSKHLDKSSWQAGKRFAQNHMHTKTF